MRDMGHRQQRIASRVHEVLGKAISLGQLHGVAQLGSLITISRVWVSSDVKHAKVFFTVTGGDNKALEVAQAALTAEASVAQRLIARQIKTFATPKLTFEPDSQFDAADRLDELLGRGKNG